MKNQINIINQIINHACAPTSIFFNNVHVYNNNVSSIVSPALFLPYIPNNIVYNIEDRTKKIDDHEICQLNFDLQSRRLLRR